MKIRLTPSGRPEQVVIATIFGVFFVGFIAVVAVVIVAIVYGSP
jgi:hypothetical protein